MPSQLSAAAMMKATTIESSDSISTLDYQPMEPLYTRFNSWSGKIMETCINYYIIDSDVII